MIQDNRFEAARAILIRTCDRQDNRYRLTKSPAICRPTLVCGSLCWEIVKATSADWSTHASSWFAQATGEICDRWPGARGLVAVRRRQPLLPRRSDTTTAESGPVVCARLVVVILRFEVRICRTLARPALRSICVSLRVREESPEGRGGGGGGATSFGFVAEVGGASARQSGPSSLERREASKRPPCLLLGGGWLGRLARTLATVSGHRQAAQRQKNQRAWFGLHAMQ